MSQLMSVLLTLDVIVPTLTGSELGDMFLLCAVFAVPVVAAIVAIVLVMRRKKKKAAQQAAEEQLQGTPGNGPQA